MAPESCVRDSCGRALEVAGPTAAEGNDGGRLCAACFDLLRTSVEQLPELYHDCEEMLLANRRTRGFERVRGGSPGGVSLDDAVVAARSDMLTVASSWAGLIVSERPVARCPRRRIRELSRFLLTHLRWLAGHAAIDDAVTEIAGVVAAAREAIEPRLGRLELGPCDHAGCGAAIYATIGAGSAPAGVRCERGHVWRPHEWLLLDRRLGRAGGSRGGEFAA